MTHYVMEKYEVQIRYYAYNDGRGNNGWYTHRVPFDSFKEAKDLADEATKHQRDGPWLYVHFRLNGYAEGPAEVYKITEER